MRIAMVNANGCASVCATQYMRNKHKIIRSLRFIIACSASRSGAGVGEATVKLNAHELTVNWMRLCRSNVGRVYTHAHTLTRSHFDLHKLRSYINTQYNTPSSTKIDRQTQLKDQNNVAQLSLRRAKAFSSFVSRTRDSSRAQR